MSTELGLVDSLTVYPLTGARGISCESAVLGAGGFEGDHVYVLYEENPKDGGFKRVSQKQCRTLAQVAVRLDEEGDLHAMRDPRFAEDGAKPWRLVVPALARVGLVDVVEFGDTTPCYDMGPDAAEAFSELLERPVRLARKTDRWLAGGVMAPGRRANATVHVGLAETVEFLADRCLAEPTGTKQFGPDRLRAQMVVRGSRPLTDADWVGGTLLIGDAGILEVDRHTKRCPVPGTDQQTGENKKDLPRLYPLTVKAPDDGKPTIGVYGHSSSDRPAKLRVGDRVRWVA